MRKHTHRRAARALAGIVALLAVVVAVPAAADPGQGRGPWKETGKPAKVKDGKEAQVRADDFRPLAVDRAALRAQLAQAPAEDAPGQGAVLVVPAPDGSFHRFAVKESPVMEAGLAAKHPAIETYSGVSLDAPATTIRADLTPLGFHASVRSPRGGWYVDPYYNGDDSVYAAYYRSDLEAPEGAFDRREPLGEDEHDHARDGEAARGLASASAAASAAAGTPVVRRTYRIAIVSDPSYASYFGAENVTAAKVTLMNRVNHIYETESAIRMVLIEDTDKTNLDTPEQVTGANGPCGAAPCFTPAQVASCGSATLTRNRIVLGQIVGASKYDVGHIVFGLNGGGIAGLGVVGGDGKARGCTGLPAPVGDFFAVDYVAHEIGHQFNSNHTFNGNQHNCSGGNRSAANSFEPGSGSSIMAYAGICRHDNLQPHTDPYWSHRSYTVIDAFVTSDRPAINEVQTVSFRDFDGTDSFTLAYGGVESAPIVRGTSYTTAAIKAAVESVTGGTATIAAWGASGSLSDTGFQVTWSGSLAATNLDALTVKPAGFTAFVGETAKGGAIDNKGWLLEAGGNTAPVAATPFSFVIPVRTPFALTGSGTDADGDELTYMWEQNDRGGAAGTALANNLKVNGPLFRVFGKAHEVTEEGTLLSPSPGLNLVDGNPTRVFPDLEQILANNTNAVTGICEPFAGVWPVTLSDSQLDCYSEFLPTADWIGFALDRTMTFRLTVRDSRPGAGGIGASDTRLQLVPTAGPFLVTSQATAVSLTAGSVEAVTWDVAGTNLAPIDAQAVKISLSVDGGYTYPHVLAESTPNDGSEAVLLPNVDTTKARIKIEAVGNVFFDISETDFEIRGAARQSQELVAASTGAGAGTALASQAEAIAASVAAGRTTPACGQLGAFRNAVAAQRGKTLSAAKADELTASAATIGVALGC